MQLYELKKSGGPLIISIPHAGTYLPEDIKKCLTPEALELPDTDWHVPLLYEDFVRANNVTLIQANYSRYVVDLNRPPDDAPLYRGQTKVSLCPDQTFDGEDIYLPGQDPDEQEIRDRVKKYWQPYHDELRRQIDRIIRKHGHAILYDAHSIRSEVPRLFKGKLPDLNLGTVNGASCIGKMAKAAFNEVQNSPYSAVLNGRFIGGYITRHYGDPANNVHAIQMELALANYAEEQTFTYDNAKAAQLKPVLERVLHAVLEQFTFK